MPSPSTVHCPHPACPRNGKGFALLVTIVLISFLVLILVALASLTRIETRIASNGQLHAQARQNALLALNIAIGELQKYTGPDQRTTARSDLDPTWANVTNANGRWTGAYGSRVAANYDDKPNVIADKIKAVYNDAVADDEPLGKKGSQAILLNWLVSGNETTDFNPLTDVATDGHITRSDTFSIPHKPDDTGLDLASVATSPDLADTYVLLVGDHSASSVSDHVAAPLVPISVPQNTLPGSDSTNTSSQTIGRYAWWVGDENTKARVNLSINSSVTPNDVAFVTSQRTGVELVDSIHPVGSVPSADIDPTTLLGYNDAYAPASSTVSRLVDVLQLPMLSAANATTLDTARKYRFHDLTSSSFSLLTDTYAGGLKKDLSALLAKNATTPANSDYLFVPNDSVTVSTTRPVPTWAQLRAQVQTTVATDTGAPSGLQAIEPRRPIYGVESGIFPVLTFAEAKLEYFNLGGAIRLAILPRIVLWNPYSMPIKAKPKGSGGDFEFGIGSIGNSWRLQASTDGGHTSDNIDTGRGMNNGAGTGPNGGGGDYNCLRFIIDLEGVDIPPGESWIFTLQAGETGRNYTITKASYPTAKPGNIMTRGIENGYALIPDSFPLSASDGTPYTDFRVIPGDGFSKNSFAYLGEIASAGPVTSDWDWDPASTSKPWHQLIPDTNLTNGGSSGKIACLQPPDKYTAQWMKLSDFDSEPGDQAWGVQLKSLFGYRTRWIANSNPRSTFSGEIELTEGYSVQSYNLVMSSDPATEFRASAGVSLAVDNNTPRDVVLFEFRPADQPLLSIGELQHANLSGFYSASTPYAVGNSAVPAEIKTDPSDSSLTRDRLFNNYHSNVNYDYAYLLNRTLWDRYFVSTVPHDGTNAAGVTSVPAILPNARLHRPDYGAATEQADLLDADKAASRLLVAGGFNINSTSEQAWRAILGGLNRLELYPDGTLDPSDKAALPRFARPSDAINRDTPAPGSPDWAYKGYRRLTEEQIARLAANIVGEVRNRGPFVSLHDFINRRLWDNPATLHGKKYPDLDHPGTYITTSTNYNGNETLKGAIQDAIDATPISGAGSINNPKDAYPFNKDRYMASYIRDDSGAKMSGPSKQYPYASPDAYAPQFLTQADVLSAIGAGLTARSDTFTVRTYGEVQNPLTGDIDGRAWCEAVVQRVVEPLLRKSADTDSPDYNEPASASGSQPDFGRRFQIVSFRWLTSNDI